MSRGFYLNMTRAQHAHLPADPRFPIAHHMSWTRPTSHDTPYNGLEPDNYNYCVLAARPLECNFIKDHVFYRNLATDNWWTAYYVYPTEWEQFNDWIMQQDCIYRWYHSKPAVLRTRKKFLYNRQNAPELTTEERLFTMGYYAKLNNKLFSDNDTILLERLGPARAEVLNYKTFQQV